MNYFTFTLFMSDFVITVSRRQASGGFEVASTIISSLQTKRLRKRASQPHAIYIRN